MAQVMDINREAKVTGNLGLTLLLLILVLPFLGVSYLLNTELNNRIQFIARQKAGFEYVNIVRTLLEHVQQHRGMANAHLSGAHEFESRLPLLTARINADVLAVEKLHAAFSSILQTSGKWTAWRKDWLKLQQQQLQISAADNFAAHTALINKLLLSIRQAVDVFHLVLDTQLDSRALATAIMQMPWQIEDIGQVRGLGSGAIARNRISTNEKLKLRALSQSINKETNDLVRNMAVLFKRNLLMQAHLSPVFDKAIKDINYFMNMLHKQIVGTTALKVSASTYFNTGTTALDDFYHLINVIENELDSLLMARLEDTQFKRTLLQVSILLVLAMTIVIYIFFLRHQAALDENRQKIKAIVNNAADSIVTINEQGLIQSFNPAAEKIFGYSADEITGQNVRCLMPEADSRLHDSYLHRYLQTGQGRIIGIGSREVEARHYDGHIFPMELAISEMQQANGKRLFIGILRDITQRKQAEADLKTRTEALQRSNQELDQFAYIASHDLKAPLRAIANLSQWIEEDMDEVMSDEAHRQMMLLRSRVQRMEGLINGILQYSRVGRIDMEIETVDVRQLLDEVIDGLAPPASFRIDIAPDMPILQTARVPLSQIFANLLSNAIKYHHRPESARVIVSVQRLNEATYEFAVADDGPGIAAEYHDKVFQIFQTLNARDKVESTGVGLTVVKKIIEQLGGKISLNSVEGHGSTFHFTLLQHHCEEASVSCDHETQEARMAR